MTVLLRYLLGMVGMDRTARTHFAGSESEARWIFMIKKKGTQSPENIQLTGRNGRNDSLFMAMSTSAASTNNNGGCGSTTSTYISVTVYSDLA
jgi:hypothetical protein